MLKISSVSFIFLLAASPVFAYKQYDSNFSSVDNLLLDLLIPLKNAQKQLPAPPDPGPHPTSTNGGGTHAQLPSLPPDIDLPPTPTASGGTRSDRCDPQSLANAEDTENFSTVGALVPESYGNGGLTASARPTLFFYLPYAVSSDSPMQLVLQNATAREEVYNRVYSDIELAPGIIALTYPEDAPDLVVGDNYYWSIRIFCGDPARDNVPENSTAWIQRVESSTAVEYLWYDRLDKSRNKPGEWNQLLEAASYAPLSEQSIQMYTP